MKRRTHHRVTGPHTVRGMTLVELVVAIVIVGIAVTSVLSTLSAQATRSAEAMIREQATAIAYAYLTEILQKNFVKSPGARTRATFDSIDDYQAPTPSPVLDQMGNAVAGLDQFQVAVMVGNGTLGGLSGIGVVKRVDVTVTHVSSNVAVLASGYRTKYP